MAGTNGKGSVCAYMQAVLEAEKKQTEEALCSGLLPVDQLTEKSKRFPLLLEELEDKTMRWLELSELE